MSAADDLLNKGFIVTHPDRNGGDVNSLARGRTIIVTGLRRSGTSLVAAMLRQAGIFMGSDINDSVHEDEEIARVLTSGDKKALRRLIRDRDVNYRTWGFKSPMLGRDLQPERISQFNNPHVIVPFRDPVAISLRNSLSEYQEPMQALQDSLRDLAARMSFVAKLACPGLLLSYEKILTLPGDLVDAITRFCGLPDNDALRSQLIGLIEPNRPSYIAVARRRYEGNIDEIADGSLRGWCHFTGSSDPVSLDLFADGALVRSFIADSFRPDLQAAGVGEGNHGFSIDLDELDLRPDAVIRIKVSQHGVELDNSNRPLSHYQAGPD